MATHTISIDEEIFRLIKDQMRSFDETPNDVLKRLLKKPTSTQNTELHLKPVTFWPYGGASFPVGLQLRKEFKGQLFTAIVVKNGILVDGLETYDSPSAAAIAVAKVSVNGWRFWQYFDEQHKSWNYISELRR